MVLAISAAALGTAMAQSICIDERFDDDSPFTDLDFAYGNNIPSSATIQGINVFRDNPAQDPAKLVFNGTTANMQGALEVLPHKARVWRLNPGERLFMGQSGSSFTLSGDGQFGADGHGISIAQVGIATRFDGASTSGALLASISYLFGSDTTHTLTYHMIAQPLFPGADLVQVRDGVVGPKIGNILNSKFSLLTTVWASQADDAAADQKWTTFPKIYYGGYENNPLAGSADSCLYPRGKGWPSGARLTSSTVGTCIYSYLDAKPASYGTTLSMPVLMDDPWILNGVTGPAGARLRTWRIEATSTTLYVDDLYYESGVRTGLTSATAAADYRLREFNQTQRFRPNPVTYHSNAQYYSSQWDPDMGIDVPVELSLFEVR